jgi:predicted  nucleic acid-binding Zn-ribbon protein
VGKDSSSQNPNEVQVTRIRQLYELQLVDTRLTRLQGALTTLDDGSALRAQVDQAHAAAEVAQAELRDRQSRLRDLELELQSTAGKAAKVEHDLYSGRISNPKELRAMQEDLEALGRQRRRIEDEMLSLMEEIERRLEQVRTLEAEREARDRELGEHMEEYATRRRVLTAELEATEKQREAQAAAMDSDLLRRYERLRDRKDGVAVTEVTRSVCGACHMTVPEALRTAAQNSDTVHTCEECGRILYVPSE